LAQIEQSEREEDRQAFVKNIGEEVEALMGQALLQLVRVQHNVKEELEADVLQALGGLSESLAAFREEFQQQLEQVGADALEAVRVDLLEVVGGIGVRVSAGAKRRMHVKHARVEGGTGFVLD
jgi:hypothetical protein